MLNLSKFILLCCLVHFNTAMPERVVELKKCDFSENLIMDNRCMPIAMNLKDYFEQPKPRTRSSDDFIQICEDAKTCYGEIKCIGSYIIQPHLDMMCESLQYSRSKNEPCISGFFEKAYQARFLNEYSCLREFAFLSENLSKRFEAFVNGESCFLDYVKDNCHRSSLEYFTENYKQFFKTFSSDPEECEWPQQKLQNIYCLTLHKEFVSEVDQLHSSPSGNQFDKTYNTCRDYQTCLNNICGLRIEAGSMIDDLCKPYKPLE